LRLLTERMGDREGPQKVVAIDYKIVERQSTSS
jgi:LacI family repressor for deo operon, udp, cdd, tsx, nupC, and nupG